MERDLSIYSITSMTAISGTNCCIHSTYLSIKRIIDLFMELDLQCGKRGVAKLVQ